MDFQVGALAQTSPRTLDASDSASVDIVRAMCTPCPSKWLQVTAWLQHFAPISDRIQSCQATGPLNILVDIFHSDKEELVAKSEGKVLKKRRKWMRTEPRLDSVLDLPVQVISSGLPAIKELGRHFLQFDRVHSVVPLVRNTRKPPFGRREQPLARKHLSSTGARDAALGLMPCIVAHHFFDEACELVVSGKRAVVRSDQLHPISNTLWSTPKLAAKYLDIDVDVVAPNPCVLLPPPGELSRPIPFVEHRFGHHSCRILQL